MAWIYAPFQNWHFQFKPKTTSKMSSILIKNGRLVNENRVFDGDIRMRNSRIESIATSITPTPSDTIVDVNGLMVIPGVIDDQVHFREPGFPEKGNLESESKAAVAGGVTSFMEMPNTNPTTTTIEALDDKLARSKGRSWANYGFFFGATNQNLEEVIRVDPTKTCGIKIFMGSSTGDMLVDDLQILEKIFASTPLVIATHCEDEKTVKSNFLEAKNQFGEEIPFQFHPLIRSREACYLSSSLAIGMAKKFGTNLHILHLTTSEELDLFEAGEMIGKKITAEVCVHHLHYCDSDYDKLGGLIKCNPAIKKASDREALWKALNDDRIDIIASDHAPHTWKEKQQKYASCPSGLPLVQHELPLMLDAVAQKKIPMEKVVRKMCHNPADRFGVAERGYLREGYFADLVVVDPTKEFSISKDGLLYHCGWSPLEGETLRGGIIHTFVNGNLVFSTDKFTQPAGIQLTFSRS